MERPKSENYYQYNPYKADTGISKYSKEQDKFIDHQAAEIKSLKQQLEKSRSINDELKHQLVKIDKSYKEQLEKERDEKNLFNSAYPSIEVMKRLINSAEILLYRKDYDGHNHEEIQRAIKEAKLYLTQNQTKDKND